MVKTVTSRNHKKQEGITLCSQFFSYNEEMNRDWKSLNEGWERLVWARERYCAHYNLKQSTAEGARIVGISNSTYSQYERDPKFQRAAPLDIDKAKRFGSKLKVSWRWLLFGEGTPDTDVKNPICDSVNDSLTRESDHDSRSARVDITEIGVPLIGAIGAGAGWIERGRDFKVLPVAVLRGQGENACVGLTITDGVPGYRAGHILIVDTERRHWSGDEVVILRKHGKVIKCELLIADAVTDGRATTFFENDGVTPFSLPEDETMDLLGAVCGTHVPARD